MCRSEGGVRSQGGVVSRGCGRSEEGSIVSRGQVRLRGYGRSRGGGRSEEVLYREDRLYQEGVISKGVSYQRVSPHQPRACRSQRVQAGCVIYQRVLYIKGGVISEGVYSPATSMSVTAGSGRVGDQYGSCRPSVKSRKREENGCVEGVLGCQKGVLSCQKGALH